MEMTLPSMDRAVTVRMLARRFSIFLFIALLAWSPFPLGGAVPWGSGLETMLIAFCATVWVIVNWGDRGYLTDGTRVIAVPLLLSTLTLVWALVQICPDVPQAWTHPVWGMASDVLSHPVSAYISLNPWRTEGDITKLASYVLAAWLAFRMSRQTEDAKLLLASVVAIGAGYALYGFVLNYLGKDQVSIFYAVPQPKGPAAGPFMLHNSFATYCGMVTVVAGVWLFSLWSSTATIRRPGNRYFLKKVTEFALGRGLYLLLAAILGFSAVVLSASRAGFAATLVGLLAVALISAPLIVWKREALGGALVLFVVAICFSAIAMNGGNLMARADEFFSADMADKVRPMLWSAAYRMISDAPWLGLGLGTFQDAYPMYAGKILPFVMDKAHCDYLEFAAGVGLPAAIAWWGAIGWVALLCFRAAFIRRRHRIYPIAAFGATAVVAAHSSVDFSLQLPAVALMYATIIGIGVAQCQSSRPHQTPRI